MKLTAQQLRLSQARIDTAKGRMPPEDYCALVRSCGVEDALAELLEANRLREQGRLAEAEQKYWRSADLAPAQPHAFMALNQMLLNGSRGEDTPNWMALEALCLLKASSHPGLWTDPQFNPIPEHLYSRLPLPKGKKTPTPAERAEMAGELLLHAVIRTGGVADARLWRHVRVATVFDDPMKDQDVDWLLEHSEETMPLLAAIVDGYREGLLGSYAEIAVENALAFLGECGGPRYLENVLTVMPSLNPDIFGAAVWTLRRWMARQPDAFAAELHRLQPRIGAGDLTWLVLALGRAAPGPSLAPLWEALFEIGCGLADHVREWSSGLAVAAHTVLGPEEARGRIARLELQFGRHWDPDARTLVQDIQKTTAADLDEFWDRVDAERPTVHQICAGAADWPSFLGENPDEEELSAGAGEAEFRLRTTGRNDPCWCGSGKKYKKCHLAGDEKLVRGGKDDQPSASSDLFGEVRRHLARFTLAALSPSQFQDRIEDFFGPQGASSEEEMPSFVDWLIHDWRPAPGRPTFLEKFLRSEGSRLDPAVRADLQSWTSSFIDLYEVLGVEEGKGVLLRRHETGEELFVHDVSSSRQLIRGDFSLSRVVRERERHVFNGDGLSVPRALLADFLNWLHADRRQTGLDRAAHFRARWPAIRQFIAELPEQAWQRLRLTNTDGDPIEFQKAVFQVLEEQSVLGALAACPVLHGGGEGAFTWMRGGPDSPGNTILGNLRVSEGRLTLECNSRNRLAAGKELLHNIAGAHLRHLADEITPIEELKRQASSNASCTPEDDIPPEIANPLIEQLLERHYSTWPDTPLPALGGQTPRDAVRTPEGRRRLEALLLDFENQAEHDRRAGRPAYDFSRLRRELGLT